MRNKWVSQKREESSRIVQITKRGGCGASQEAEGNNGVLNGRSADDVGMDLEELGFLGA